MSVANRRIVLPHVTITRIYVYGSSGRQNSVELILETNQAGNLVVTSKHRATRGRIEAIQQYPGEYVLVISSGPGTAGPQAPDGPGSFGLDFDREWSSYEIEAKLNVERIKCEHGALIRGGEGVERIYSPTDTVISINLESGGMIRDFPCPPRVHVSASGDGSTVVFKPQATADTVILSAYRGGRIKNLWVRNSLELRMCDEADNLHNIRAAINAALQNSTSIAIPRTERPDEDVPGLAPDWQGRLRSRPRARTSMTSQNASTSIPAAAAASSSSNHSHIVTRSQGLAASVFVPPVLNEDSEDDEGEEEEEDEDEEPQPPPPLEPDEPEPAPDEPDPPHPDEISSLSSDDGVDDRAAAAENILHVYEVDGEEDDDDDDEDEEEDPQADDVVFVEARTIGDRVGRQVGRVFSRAIERMQQTAAMRQLELEEGQQQQQQRRLTRVERENAWSAADHQHISKKKLNREQERRQARVDRVCLKRPKSDANVIQIKDDSEEAAEAKEHENKKAKLLTPEERAKELEKELAELKRRTTAKCAICQTDASVVDPVWNVISPCGHTLCDDCIRINWVKQGFCPNCRGKITVCTPLIFS
jgi:hypothetical protein